jgi:hypothetical protein
MTYGVAGMSHRQFLSFAAVLAMIILAGYISTRIQITSKVTRPCHLLAQTEWLLLKTGSDAFEAHLQNRFGGKRHHIDMFRFQRGDVVRFSLSGNLAPGGGVEAGEEIARLESRENQERLDQLRPQLQEAEAGLRSAESGAKNEVVAQARSELEAARALAGRREAEFRRAISLWDQGLISRVDYDKAEARHLQTKAEVTAATNRLEAAEAGEKETIIEALQARVHLLEQQISDAEERVNAGRIRCPIDGTVVTLPEDSALVRVASFDTLCAVAAVSPARLGEIEVGQRATFLPSGWAGGSTEGRVVHVEHYAISHAGQTLFWVTVALPNEGEQLAAGIGGRLRFEGQKTSLLNWIYSQLRRASERTLGA